MGRHYIAEEVLHEFLIDEGYEREPRTSGLLISEAAKASVREFVDEFINESSGKDAKKKARKKRKDDKTHSRKKKSSSKKREEALKWLNSDGINATEVGRQVLNKTRKGSKKKYDTWRSLWSKKANETYGKKLSDDEVTKVLAIKGKIENS